jgi:hypothetical protein
VISWTQKVDTWEGKMGRLRFLIYECPDGLYRAKWRRGRKRGLGRGPFDLDGTWSKPSQACRAIEEMVESGRIK